MPEEINIKEMRHDVIEYAISLEDYLDEEILSYFGLDSWDADYNMEIERQREIFKKFFLSMSLSRKFKLIKKIIKNLNEELYEDFGIDVERYIEIRNRFAHSIYPEVEEEFMPKMKIDFVKLEQKDWKQMYNEAKILYFKIIKELDSKFYTEDPRNRKHRRFDEAQLLEVIKHYEQIIKEDYKK